jgi:hypothetical protein
MAAKSGGISDVSVTEETTEAHDFPTILSAILSKQNILAPAVPSDAMNVNLYLEASVGIMSQYLSTN